jgi:hypothetical protein
VLTRIAWHALPTFTQTVLERKLTAAWNGDGHHADGNPAYTRLETLNPAMNPANP